jgi:hypothetical protein
MGRYGQAVCPMWHKNLESVIIEAKWKKKKKKTRHIYLKAVRLGGYPLTKK